ncbi:MAG: class I SAM-dependent methyltransferase [Gammaproteobacteria bacterium]|nr:class I SAM-dependent methyltransferase [Gammaproteobacteria bacterium]
MAEPKHYVLQSNKLSMQRLIQQHRLYEKSSQHLLLDAGLKPGLSVLELGCGPGLMTEWLCQQLDETSTLAAIDISPDYVNAAQDRTASYNYCKVMVMDAHDIAHLQQKFDLICARMVFHHLHNSAVLLQQAADCLRPNGVVVFEENPAMEQVFSYPQLPALEKFKQLTVKTFAISEANYKIAYTRCGPWKAEG